MLLRLEGLVLLLVSVVAYRAVGGSWGMFALLLLVPDVGLVGYLAGARIGAVAYNALHTYIGPALLGALVYLGVLPTGWLICLIWLAHIGMDRALGLGLKFSSGFRLTHLGAVGNVATTT